ncbi:MAG: deoxyribonuclease IV [Lachnospiraceae bacterium]|nr:deoxyribonuclease IV [Lachnospiraceae bacterium]
MLLGSHVGMSGKEMMLGSVKEALSYGANTFMLYTGAPQNTRRKEISELNIEAAHELMAANAIAKFVVHAPYIINLANTVNPETYDLAVTFLRKEIERTEAMGSDTLVLHPGAHVGAGEDAGIASIVKGLNEVLTADCKVHIALETMAGKGSEIGSKFEELARIYDGVQWNSKLRICMDTCHLNDAGFDVKNDFEGVLKQFERFFPLSQIACIHLNDSKNEQGAAKDRHENIGFGTIGYDALCGITKMSEFENTPIILETPYREIGGSADKLAPYKFEIAMLRVGAFNPKLFD